MGKVRVETSGAKSAEAKLAEVKANANVKAKAGAKKGEQLALRRTAGHGGARAGAGRKKEKRKGRSNVAHATRPGLGKSTPVHVTLRMLPGRPSLRAELIRKMFERIVEETRDEEFHVAKYSLQKDHAHLLCEPKDRAALSSGIRRVAIRFARRMNKLFGRTKGKCWGDRYHRHDLRTPREVRNALVYVLMNGKKHGECAPEASFIDPYSSAAESDVWEDWQAGPPRVCEAPRYWLLGVGWKKRGLLRTTEAPMVAA